MRLQMLKQAKSSPDIDNYLCLLLSDRNAASILQSTPEDLHVARSAAGIMLKNDLKARYKSIQESSKSYIRSHIIQGLNDRNAQIRSYCGNVITELVRQGGVLGWRDVLTTLISIVRNQNGQTSTEAQDGAMGALLKICEDNRKALSKGYENQNPSDYLVPNLLQITSSPLGRVRANAVAALNIFLEARVGALVDDLDTFLSTLFQLANDSSEEVKKGICRAIVRTAEYSPRSIIPHLQPLVKYLLEQQQNDEDPELALEAAEFWLTAGEEDTLKSHLGPYISDIVPVLLQCMIYNEDDVLRLEEEDEADSASAQDRQQDIKPVFATQKTRTTADGKSESSEEGEIEEDDQGLGGDDPEEQWNLRKCSAAALDVLATVFKEPVFLVTLPYLKENLSHKDWPNREAAVLAIGAVAEGCIETVSAHLPDIIPYLISLLDDQFSVVRKIACWSIGRYSGWAASLDESGKERFFVPIMDGLLKHMLDNNKRVQEAAASAFFNLEENAQAEVGRPEYLQVIVQQYLACFEQYKDRNMLILLDGVATLAGIVGSFRQMLPNPDIIGSLMPALNKRLEIVPNSSRELFPLLECLTCMANALQTSLTPYAQSIYDRCIQITFQNLEDANAAAENPELEAPDKDYLITSLDLVGALVQSLDTSETKRILGSSQPRLFELLPLCLNDPISDVQQSAFALLGDCAGSIYDEVQPHLDTLMRIIVARLDTSTVTKEAVSTGYPVINNACWSCGEIALRSEGAIADWSDTLLRRLFDIMTSIDHPVLRENAAVALGRLSGTSPERVAPHLSHVASQLLNVLQEVNSEEKVSAISGFSKAVLANPQALDGVFPGYLMVVAKAREADALVQQVRLPISRIPKRSNPANMVIRLSTSSNNIPITQLIRTILTRLTGKL